MRYKDVKRVLSVLIFAGALLTASFTTYADEAEQMQENTVRTEAENPEPESAGMDNTEIVNPDIIDSETAPVDSQNADIKSADSGFGDSELVDSQNADIKSVDSGFGDSELVDSQNVDIRPADFESGNSELVNSESTESEFADSETTYIEPADSGNTDTELVDSEITDSEITDREIADPEIADPETTDREIEDPEITDPEMADPEKSDRKITDPEITDSENPDSENADVGTMNSENVVIKTICTANLDSETTDPKAEAPETGAAEASDPNMEIQCHDSASAQSAKAVTDTGVKTPVKVSAKTSANVSVKSSAKTPAKVSAKTSAGTTAKQQLIPNGVYSFLSALNPFKAIDIYHAKTSDRANAQAYDMNNSDAQHFRITYHPEDGTYSIMNMKSGKYLDVSGGKNVNGANVQQYRGNNTPAQRWVVRQQSDGSYTFLSALGKSERALDLKGGSSANDTNLQIYRANGTKAQSFFLQPYDQRQRVRVSDGIYTLVSQARKNGTGVVDICGASMNDGANVQLYTGNGTAAQKFSLVASGGGYYRLMSCSSGRVLSIRNGKAERRANVQQDQSAWLTSQKWLINDAGDGSVYLKSADGDYYLDVAGGKSTNGTNIQLYEGNGSNAQKFRLIKETAGSVEDGVYFIKSVSNAARAVDIYDASKKMQANARLYVSNGTDAQKFRFTRGKDGLYTVVSINSGHALDIAAGSMENGANLQQYRTNDSLAQKWIPRINKDGSMLLISAKSGKVLDTAGGRPVPKANLQQYSYNGSPGQIFRLEKTTGTVTKERDYSIEPPPIEEKFPQAAAVIQQIGKSLQAALNWSAGLPYVDSGMDISAGSRALANRGFTTHTGDCYVMAATFYEMAQVLGYNAHQMFGYVPLARGGMGVHSWVEVDKDGTTYVCDPDFQHETGGNGYMLHYGMSGTWRYSNYHRIN